MGKKCVAAGCSNSHRNNVSLFKFPTDKNLRMQWIRQVQRTRADWKEPGGYSCVCSDHFTLDCFQPISLISKKLQLTRKQMLKPDAVPTIFPKPSSISQPTKRKSISSALEKRERARILSSIEEESIHSEKDTAASPTIQLTTMDDESACVNQHNEVHDLPSESHSKCQDVNIQVEPVKCSKGIEVKPSRWHVETQTDTPQRIEVCDVGIQCCLLPSEPLRSSTPDIDDTLPAPDLHVSAIEEDMSTYEPPNESMQLPDIDPVEEKKYIVFESNLLHLFRRCPVCRSPSIRKEMYSIGTFLSIQTTCDDCELKEVWDSQPYIRNIPAGNILLSAAILFSGALPRKTLRVFNVFNCASISESLFYEHQKKYLQQSVRNVWTRQQSAMVAVLNAEKKGLVVGGDGRCDSPGFCAKYGAYSFMELEYNAVLNIELVQSNEVNGSYYMEKEGLIRGIKFFENEGLDLSILITDRHRAIAKWIRDTLPDVEHKYDVWHIAKGFRKKLEDLAKKKSCELVGQWTRSLVNHLYWSIMSTKDGNSEEVMEKWLSVINHIHDKHSGHGIIYEKCTHGQIKRKWFKHHTKASEELKKIISKSNLCNDIIKASNSYQTSRLEAFHSLINQFAPKHTCFSYSGMTTRLLLSAIHYNHNSNRTHATTKNGNLRYSIMFPKYKKGGYITRKIKIDSEYDYVNDVLEELLHIVDTGNVIAEQPTPPPLCNNYVRPDKAEAVKKHMTRFTNQHDKSHE